MKTILFAAGVGWLAYQPVQAQTPGAIRVKGGVEGTKTVSIEDRYRYSQFRDGRLLFLNGTTAAARFNYNVLLGEMQFIDPHGDTLALTNEPVVRMVSIGEPVPSAGTSSDQSSRQDVFLYDQTKGYLELTADYNGIKLAVKQSLKTVKNEKLGGYGQSSGTAAITNYQYIASGNTSVRKLDAKGDLLLMKQKSYYFIDQNNRSYVANRASLLKVFGKHREQVTAYLANESIDFRLEDDLKKLLNHCSQL